jgi:hypothetical protein
MPDFNVNVPFYPPAGALPQLIATQRPDYSWIGNLPDAYWAGQNQEYQQRQRNLFQQGIPSDLGQLGRMLLQAGGAPQVENYLRFQQIAAQQQAEENARQGGLYGPVRPDAAATNIPSGTPPINPPPAQPVSLSAPSTANVTVRTGTQNLTDQELTNQPQTTTSGMTYGQFADKYKLDKDELEYRTGKSRGDIIDFKKDPQNRQILFDSVQATLPQGGERPTAVAQTGAPPPNVGATAQPSQVPPFQTGAQPLPPSGTVPGVPATSVRTAQVAPQTAAQPVTAPESPGSPGYFSLENAQKYENRARAWELAAGNLLLPAETQKRFHENAQNEWKQAQDIREHLGKNIEATPEMKTAASIGMSVSDFNRLTEAQKLDAKTYADTQTSLSALAGNAQANLQKAQLGKQLTQQAGFLSGPFSSEYQIFQQFRNIFGEKPGAALPAEAFQKVVNDMLAEQVREMGKSGVGRVLQSEVNVMRNAIASMKITDVSNRALMEIVQRAYNRSINMADIARNMELQRQQQGRPPPSSAELNARLQNYLRNNRMFTDDELRNPELLGSKEPPPQSAGWNKAQMQQWGAQNGLRPGDPAMFNGHLIQIPLGGQDFRGNPLPPQGGYIPPR